MSVRGPPKTALVIIYPLIPHKLVIYLQMGSEAHKANLMGKMTCFEVKEVISTLQVVV